MLAIRSSRQPNGRLHNLLYRQNLAVLDVRQNLVIVNARHFRPPKSVNVNLALIRQMVRCTISMVRAKVKYRFAIKFQNRLPQCRVLPPCRYAHIHPASRSHKTVVNRACSQVPSIRLLRPPLSSHRICVAKKPCPFIAVQAIVRVHHRTDVSINVGEPAVRLQSVRHHCHKLCRCFFRCIHLSSHIFIISHSVLICKFCPSLGVKIKNRKSSCFFFAKMVDKSI